MTTQRKKVLILDDDKSMCASIRNMLALVGKYEVRELTDSLQAENIIEDFSPDLIILDIKMPGKGGYEICMNTKNNAKHENIKIIGMSGISGGIGASFMETLGADYYLEKPFDLLEFTKAVRNLIGA